MHKSLALLIALTIQATASQAATLNAFDVTLEIPLFPPFKVAEDVVVGPGAEVVASTATTNIELDMASDSTFSISYDMGAVGGLALANQWTLNDFSFDFPTAVVTSATMTAVDASLASVSFTGTSITVDVAAFVAVPGEIKTFEITYTSTPTPTPVVPVPASLPLLAGALGFGALVLRRRKS